MPLIPERGMMIGGLSHVLFRQAFENNVIFCDWLISTELRVSFHLAEIPFQTMFSYLLMEVQDKKG